MPFPAPPVTPRRFPAGAGAPQPPGPRKRATSGTRSCDAQPGHGCSAPAPAGRRQDLRSGGKKPNPAPGERRRRSLFPLLRTQTPHVTHRLWPQGSEAEPGQHTGVWASPGDASHGLRPARKSLRYDPAPLHPAKPVTKLATETSGSRREPAPQSCSRGLQERGRGVPPSHARDAGVGELLAPSPSAFPCHKAPGTPASRRFAASLRRGAPRQEPGEAQGLTQPQPRSTDGAAVPAPVQHVLVRVPSAGGRPDASGEEQSFLAAISPSPGGNQLLRVPFSIPRVTARGLARIWPCLSSRSR